MTRHPRRLLATTVIATALVAACSSAPFGSAGVRPSVLRATTPYPSVDGSPRSSSAPCGWLRHTTYRHVIWIWMENRSYGEVLGSGSGAPNLAAYAAACGVATNYSAIAHPSLPNYIAATSGATHGISSDCDPSGCPVAGRSLFGQLDRSGAGWTAYAEDMQRPCDESSYGHYAARHNPAVYYTALHRSCSAHDIEMGGKAGAFAQRLAAGELRGLTFITPNLCDDGHDCATSTADRWLGYWLDRITSSPVYRAGETAVFVTWDEGETASNRVATVVISPTVVAGTRSGKHFTHYSLLATTETLLHVGHLGAATTAQTMQRAFNL